VPLLKNAGPSPDKRGAAALASAPSVRRSREPKLGIFAPAAALRHNRPEATFIARGRHSPQSRKLLFGRRTVIRLVRRT